MASPSSLQTPLLLLHLLLLLAFSSAQTYAWESRFFSKTTREQPKEGMPTTGTPAAATEKERVPATLPPQTHGGYGLYGRVPDRFLPATTASRYGTYNYNGGGGAGRNTEVENEELNAVYNYGEQWRPEDNNPSRFSDEYDTNAAAAATTREWSDEVDPNRQSYSYGVNGGRDPFAYNSQRWRGNPDRYGVYNYGGRSGNHGGRRTGYGSRYEKNNAALDESREEYDP